MPLYEGTTVRVHYRGTLNDGAEFDSSEGRDPLEFTLGASQVIPGFESAVVDLTPGDQVTVTIEAENAYGPRLDDAMQNVPVSAFWETPEPGMVVQLVAPDGSQLAATVVEVGEEEALLDFNHPLAGQALTFDITLVEVIGAN
ncbi:MAG: peptidylprolyl isomerase [Actinobacteria bacterium]|nr:peptidylprolyl isomerase [Actinomycetota bacterium]